MKKRRRFTLEESVDGIPKFARVGKEGSNKRGVEAFLSSYSSGVIFVRGSAKEFEVMR